SGARTRIKAVVTADGERDEAFPPMAITLTLADEIDVSRGDMIVGLDALPGMSSELHAKVCWMHRRPLQRGNKYLIKHTTQTVQAVVTSIENKMNIQAFEPDPEVNELALNDIGEIRLRTARPLVFDGYETNRLTGSFILIEQGTFATVAAGMLLPPLEAVKPEYNDFTI
ncbi:MAG: sulfate adenylyltransferase, partial [Verrucomicrobia bacterium]|nr:sulfate adenylyltransferase [Verrucomicrobiota bacterium]